jgi:zinc and cadmium transporter
MTTLLWILTATAVGGVLSALVAALYLLVPEPRRTASLPHLVSFATGALLGAALLKLLPSAIERAGLHNVHLVGVSVVGGILAFFALEKLVLWRHCHIEDCDSHGVHLHEQRQKASGYLILTGDAIHNLLDGVLIAAAFLYSTPTGIAASVAVVAHEIPQEVGDFAILLNSGMSRRRAFALNVITSLTSVIGGVIAYFALSQALEFLPYAVAVAAASFLYVAVADLIPGLHRRIEPLASLQQVILIAIGIAVIVVTDLH